MMTPKEKQQLKVLLVHTSLYFNHEIPDPALTLYVEDLADLSLLDVSQALMDLRRDPKTKHCPTPAAIRDRIKPQPTDENQAIEVVGRVVEALSKHGWNNHEKAKEHIGELGWLFIQREGGWLTVCESLTYDDMGTFKAQARNSIKALLASARAGTLDRAPSLPSQSYPMAIDVTKLLPTMPVAIPSLDDTNIEVRARQELGDD
jgi:hypothetical protein